ncbi:MAG: thymidine phosphorylase [bacterium]|nr:thymidine phosphorylase [bacterium]
MTQHVQHIIHKRDGNAHDLKQFRAFLTAYTQGEVPDYQMAAWLMAAWLRGLSAAETACLTEAVRDSGACLNLQHIDRPKVDKHSTGGVGDKTSLVLLPLLAAAGVCVPMMSGRGLGHTGGTLDKLEAMPGMNVRLPTERYLQILETLGGVFMAQTDAIAPLDRKLYALRDVTGTIESIPLITASIIGKKATEDLDALVLDVKCGNGAFMREPAQAHALAQSLVQAAKRLGMRTVALITDMNEPLGAWIGNAVETREALAMLRGEAVEPRFQAVTLQLAGEMLQAAQPALTVAAARAILEQHLRDGSACERFMQVAIAQGVSPATCANLPACLAPAPVAQEIRAPRSGILQQFDTARIGRLLGALGAGRAALTDVIDPAIALQLHVHLGDPVNAGAVLATLYTRSSISTQDFVECMQIGDGPCVPSPLVLERIC